MHSTDDSPLAYVPSNEKLKAMQAFLCGPFFTDRSGEYFDNCGFKNVTAFAILCDSRDLISAMLSRAEGQGQSLPIIALEEDYRYFFNELIVAVARGQGANVVPILFEKFPRLAQLNNETGQTVAHVAAFSNNIEVMRIIRSSAPELLEQEDSCNFTALDYAVRCYLTDMTRIILNECEHFHLTTQMHYAATIRNVDAFRAIYHYGHMPGDEFLRAFGFGEV